MSDTSGVVIEAPAMSDLDELVELWIALADGQRAHGSHLLAGENRARIRESLARQIALSEVQVARAAGEIVGFVMYAIEDSTFERSVSRGVIQNLYVVPDRRDQRIGSRLLEAAESALEASGADVLGLEVLEANADARRFYRRHGYEPHRITLEKASENDTS